MLISNFKFANFGNLEKGSLKINDLTILTGPNNSGKTYLTYALYGMYKNLHRLELEPVKELMSILNNEGIVTFKLDQFIEDNLATISNDLQSYLKSNLPKIFNYADHMIFDRSNFSIIFDLDKIKDNMTKVDGSNNIMELKMSNEKSALVLEYDAATCLVKIVLFENDLPSDIIIKLISRFVAEIMLDLRENEIFIMPSERAGLNLFYKELSEKRNALIESLVKFENKNSVNPFDLIMRMTSRYPQPISDYIHFLSKIEVLKKKDNIFKDLTKDIRQKILNGNYRVREDEIYFLPYKSNKTELNLHVASSTVKSIFGLHFYLDNVAKVGDLLLIDEPELNLHPDNHRKLARVICRAVNNGIRVILSTHSDHFIKEINNLIMLSVDFAKKDDLMKKYRYKEDEPISKDKVSAYIVDNKTVVEIEIDNNEGILRSTFDDVINDFNESNDDIYFSKQEDLSE